MANFLDLEALEAVQQGIILLHESGRPTSANRSAYPWLRDCVANSGRWGKVIDDLNSGKVTSPVLIELAGNPPAKTTGASLVRNGQNAFAILIGLSSPKSSLQGKIPVDLQSTELFAFFSKHLSQSIEAIQLKTKNIVTRIGEDDIVKDVAELSDELVDLQYIFELTNSQLVAPLERIDIDELLGSLGNLLPSKIQLSGTPYQHTKGHHCLGVVYGRRPLLQQVFVSLLIHLGDTCRPGWSVTTDSRQIGNFLYLQYRAVAVKEKSRPLVRRPLEPVIQKVILSASLCEQIILAHDGQLTIKHQDLLRSGETSNFVDSIMIMLPTGAPGSTGKEPACNSCPAIAQAQQYAEDFATALNTMWIHAEENL